VDPDNRRPVDFAARRRALADPPPKLRLIRDALALRARKPETFATGAYEALDAGDGVCAYLRGDDVMVCVPVRPGAKPRLPRLPGDWREVVADDTGLALLERV
jgi:(1->4)-alpha-D-glucan 1-alpha-D-glucosylmutase